MLESLSEESDELDEDPLRRLLCFLRLRFLLCNFVILDANFIPSKAILSLSCSFSSRSFVIFSSSFEGLACSVPEAINESKIDRTDGCWEPCAVV